MTQLENAVKRFPLEIQEQIITGLEAAGISEIERLRIILPVLSSAIQVSKDEETGSLKTTLIDPRDSKVMVREDEKLCTIADFINTFPWSEQYADGRETISYEESQHPTAYQIEQMAAGKMKVLPHPKNKPEKGAVPASSLFARHKGSPDTADIASGKIPVDMDR